MNGDVLSHVAPLAIFCLLLGAIVYSLTRLGARGDGGDSGAGDWGFDLSNDSPSFHHDGGGWADSGDGGGHGGD